MTTPSTKKKKKLEDVQYLQNAQPQKRYASCLILLLALIILHLVPLNSHTAYGLYFNQSKYKGNMCLVSSEPNCLT